MTRKSKTKPTNRQQQSKAVMCDIIKNSTYPKMRFWGEWLRHIDTMPRDEGDALLFAIAGYGLREIEPTKYELTAEAVEYFNTKIRPELDRQHKRFNAGKKI